MPKVLERLGAAGVDYAILHGADRARMETVVSDLDVVVRISPDQVIDALRGPLEAIDLIPIMEWPYDLGRTLTVFLSSPDGRNAMQLDMLCDHRGLGRYAVRSAQILDRAIVSDGLHVINPVDECVYLTMKRAVKEQQVALDAVVAAAGEFDPVLIDEAINAVFTRPGRKRVRSILTRQAEDVGLRPARRVLTMFRVLRRFSRPTGVWVHVADRAIATGVHDRFAGYLPHSMLAQTSFLKSDVQAFVTRMRPSIVVTYGRQPQLKPDAILHGPTVDLACRELVGVMGERTRTRLAET